MVLIITKLTLDILLFFCAILFLYLKNSKDNSEVFGVKKDVPIMVTRPFMPKKAEYKKYVDKIWDNQWLTNKGPLFLAVLFINVKLVKYTPFGFTVPVFDLVDKYIAPASISDQQSLKTELLIV